MSFWVVNESFTGTVVGGLIPGESPPLMHVVSASARPAGSPVYGPYPNRLAAQAVANQVNAAAKGAYKAGVAADPGAPASTGSVPNPMAGLTDIGDFFHRLTEKSTWTRVGEVALGGILLYAGVRALSHGTAAGASARKGATAPVRKVAKTATRIAVPEARLASRTVAKKAAPKTTARVAAHRAHVARYGAKRPVGPPKPSVRTTHIYHHRVKP